MTQDLALEELYRELIVEHYRNPHNYRELPRFDVRSEGANPLCGDEVALELWFESDRVGECGFGGRGCAISQASASMMTDAIRGKNPDEIQRLIAACERMVKTGETAPPGLGDLEVLQGVARFPVRVKCALLAWKVLRDALEEYEETRGAVEQQTT